MNQNIAALIRLRRVFAETRQGKGAAAALVKAFGPAGGREKEVAKRILLGLPVEAALRPLTEKGTRELTMLAGLLAKASASSTEIVGTKGERLSVTLERWLNRKEARLMEQRVMQMRCHIMSAVVGAVVAMLASLGPMVASLSLLTQTAPTPNSEILLWTSGFMVCVSSAMLGLFMSGRRFILDVAIALVTFALVCYAVGPLVTVPVVTLWGNILGM